MRVLIPTHPGDVHAVEISLVLQEQGHEVVRWYGSDFPTLQSASVELSQQTFEWELRGPGLTSGGVPPFEVVWMRRPTPPVLPEGLHPSDVLVARRECLEFQSSLYQLVAPQAFWVNPLESRPRAEFKAVQLREAVHAGLSVPPTLMSNDPARIREFITRFHGRTIFKPFFIAQWDREGGVAMMLTNDVTLEDLPSDETLRATPGIFQARIPKAHELRVTIMGHQVITARLRSQEVKEARLDWRGAGGLIRIEPDELPPQVEEACLRLMRRLGLLYGAFDFIVTPEGEHVFLEVNPAGQFLWVEEANPDILVLAPFVEFLQSRRPDFRWKPTSGGFRHRDYYPRACEQIAAEQSRHVPPAQVFVSSDEPGPRAKGA
jgi:glutathione synthase/RimK-type ligase-like ATP-grasp enzyme